MQRWTQPLLALLAGALLLLALAPTPARAQPQVTAVPVSPPAREEGAREVPMEARMGTLERRAAREDPALTPEEYRQLAYWRARPDDGGPMTLAWLGGIAHFGGLLLFSIGLFDENGACVWSCTGNAGMVNVGMGMTLAGIPFFLIGTIWGGIVGARRTNAEKEIRRLNGEEVEEEGEEPEVRPWVTPGPGGLGGGGLSLSMRWGGAL